MIEMPEESPCKSQCECESTSATDMNAPWIPCAEKCCYSEGHISTHMCLHHHHDEFWGNIRRELEDST